MIDEKNTPYYGQIQDLIAYCYTDSCGFIIVISSLEDSIWQILNGKMALCGDFDKRSHCGCDLCSHVCILVSSLVFVIDAKCRGRFLCYAHTPF